MTSMLCAWVAVSACILLTGVQPVEPLKVKPPIIPPKHPKPAPADKPVDTNTPKAPTPDPADSGDALLPFPHPLITEILFAVPAGENGDANRDGSRHATGDEFIELINPHSKPIQLKGYTLTDRNPPGKGQLRFVFPALELPPGGVVLIFNGCEQGWGKGEQSLRVVGDAKAPPKHPNPHFHGAFVFTLKNTSDRTSWSNTGDYALLSDVSGNPIHCVHWGDFNEPVPAATLTEKLPITTKASLQRISLAGPFTAHTDIESPEPPSTGDDDPATIPSNLQRGRPFSPGWFAAGTPAAHQDPTPQPTDGNRERKREKK